MVMRDDDKRRQRQLGITGRYGEIGLRPLRTCATCQETDVRDPFQLTVASATADVNEPPAATAAAVLVA